MVPAVYLLITERDMALWTTSKLHSSACSSLDPGPRSAAFSQRPDRLLFCQRLCFSLLHFFSLAVSRHLEHHSPMLSCVQLLVSALC